MNLNTFPPNPTDAQGYEISPCSYPGHDRYWLAGGSRGEPTPPAKAGIWRCVVCCPPLSWVAETKAANEILPTSEN